MLAEVSKELLLLVTSPQAAQLARLPQLFASASAHLPATEPTGIGCVSSAAFCAEMVYEVLGFDILILEIPA